MADNDRLAAALAYQGATAAPPTMAQQLAKVPSRLIGALKALGTGSSYGSAEPVNAVNDLARTRFWRGSVFGVPEDVQERNQARAMEAASMAAPIVYHGTPHRFAATAKNPLGEFDPTKIGTGEGAQVYGYGHYVAELPTVAAEYKRNLGGLEMRDKSGALMPIPENVRWVAKDLSAAGGDYGKVRAQLAEHGKFYPWPAQQGAKYIDELEAVGAKPNELGSLYKVDLPDESVARMLDYDKHLSEQSPQVQKILSDYQKQLGTSFGRGDQVLKEIAFDRRMKGLDDSPAAVAKQLKELGIPGIKYLDAGSRGASTGTRNFVVFPGNEGLLNILGRE